jgi:hypothetical protein
MQDSVRLWPGMAGSAPMHGRKLGNNKEEA